MRYQKSNHAFTLIEIAVVLVILGLIAVLAFPGLFAQIERHRGQEALSNLNLIKSTMETCGIQNGYNFTQCNSWDILGMANPGGGFTYEPFGALTDSSGSNQGTYVLVARRTGSPDTITITRNNAGQATCAGTGAFNGFCS